MDIKAMLDKHHYQLISIGNPYHTDARRDAWGSSQVNNDSHIIHILQGKSLFRIHNTEYVIQRGSVLFVPRFSAFEFMIQSNVFEMINIHYNLLLADGKNLEDRMVFDLHVRPGSFDAIERRLRELYHANQTGNLKLSAWTHEFILDYLDTIPITPTQLFHADTRMQHVRRMLSGARQNTFSAEQIATECHLSTSQLNRRFRAAFGFSPKSFWEQQRFHRIVTELAKCDSDSSVGALAERFGFCDVTYFCRWFKKMSGYSPLQYGKKVLVHNERC